ncbi:MAG TPA: Ig-like domain-containing protein [Candidatus Limnocylindria bacterium]|nr:Ig-like domain-containing protein [Candidatus Limnocylindria bacterium]
MRGASLRSLAALAIGVVILGGILYVASTVDGRDPNVDRIGLTHHLSADDEVALTTTSIEVIFSEAVDRPSAEAAFRIQPATDGAFSWSAATMTFTPDERLPLETDFVVSIVEGVRDAAGNTMTEPVELAFVTVGHPTIVATEPEGGAEDVPLAAEIVLQFSTLMDTASVEEALTISPEVPLTPTWSGEALTLTPEERLAEGVRYTLRVDDGARDSAGTPLSRAFTLSFRAVRSGLAATTLFPADGVEGIALTSPIALVFDRPLDPDTVNPEQFVIEPDITGSLSVVPTPGAAGMVESGERVLRLRPASPLQANTTYRISLAPGLTGTDGAALAAPIEWRFTTGAPLATLSNQIVFLSERAGIANLWAMNPDGTGQRQLSAELSPIHSYAVAPDGRSFVVGDGAILIRQQADGGGRQQLTPDGVLEIDPAFSPNGAELAFARVDPITGGGLGLWTRPTSGGDAGEIELPRELGAPPATPVPSGAVAPILRAPRYSPDGAALAFVDMSGRVGVVELPADRLTTAPFAAVYPPTWRPDSTGLLLSGSPAGALEPTLAGEPLPPLDPGSLQLSSFEVGALRIADLDRGADEVQLLDQPPGASRPEAGQGGRYLFIVADASQPRAGGDLWLTTAGGSGFPVLTDGGGSVASAGFGPETRDVVAARSAAAGEGSESGGIWLVDATSGDGRQLSDDGWMPRWLP